MAAITQHRRTQNSNTLQWSLPKRTLREADNPLQRTNLVAWIEFAKHVILKQSPRSGLLRIPNNEQGTGPEWRVLMQNIAKERTTRNCAQ